VEFDVHCGSKFFAALLRWLGLEVAGLGPVPHVYEYKTFFFPCHFFSELTFNLIKNGEF